MENVTHWKKATAVTFTDLDNLNGDLQTWFDSVKGYFSDDLSLVATRCTDLTTLAGASAYSTVTPALVGGHGQPSLPGNCAVVVTKRTAKRGRAYRGRLYQTGVPEDAQDGVDTVTTTWVNNMLTAFGHFLVSSEFHSLVFSVLSNFLGGVVRGTGLAEPVTEISIDTSIDSQRRRLLGRGT